MAKRLPIDEIEERLQDHLLQIEQLFPFGVSLAIVGISHNGWDFVLGDADPDEIIACVNRAFKRDDKELVKVVATLKKSTQKRKVGRAVKKSKKR
jgi:hypothetical protein